MTTMKLHQHLNPQVAAVLNGTLRVGETYGTMKTVTNWYRNRRNLEFTIADRSRRVFRVTVMRKDPTLRRVDQIMRTEPNYILPDGLRVWQCAVGFGHTRHFLTGFESKIECTLAARGWFIAYGISPDSPGGWL